MTVPIAVLASVFSYCAGLITSTQIVYLTIYEIIIVFAACDIGILIFKFNVGPSKAVFATSIILVLCNFIAMFLFSNNFMLYILPYVLIVSRLQVMHLNQPYEWTFMIITLCLCIA